MNTKLFRLAVSGILAAGAAIGATTISEIVFTTPNWAYSSRAFAQSPAEEIYPQASQAVVAIETDDGSGSGIIIRPNGLILTNAHVVQDAHTVTVLLKDSRKFQAEVIGFGANCLDLALVKIPNQNHLPTLSTAGSGSVRFGERSNEVSKIRESDRHLCDKIGSGK